MSQISAFFDTLSLTEVDLVAATLQLLQYIGSIAAVGSILLMLTINTSGKTESHFWSQATFGSLILIIVEPFRLIYLLLNLFDNDWALAFSNEGFELLVEVSTGQAGLARTISAIFLLLCIWRQWRGLALVPALIILLSYTLTGHTASYDPEVTTVPPFALSALIFIHVVLVHWWIAVFYPLLKLTTAHNPATAFLSHRFGFQASIAVPILIGSGGLLLAILVDWQIDIRQGYQAWFFIKLLFVGLILLIAALNKIRFAKNLKNPSEFKTFATSLKTEFFIALFILTATSLAISVGLDF